MKFLTSSSEIFEKTRQNNFKELLLLASSIKKDLDIGVLYEDYINGNKALDKLQDIWYDNNYDFSVYDSDYYLAEAFRCWKDYSCRYLKLFRKFVQNNSDMFNSISSVVDIGCGIAYSTVAIKCIFPNAEVFGTNLPNTLQSKLGKIVTSSTGCILVDDNLKANDGKHIDILFASEFFEHIPTPIDMLIALINTYTPNYIVFANTFTQKAIGHFNEYFYGDAKLYGTEVSRLFSKTLKYYGYGKVNTHFYNNRPNIYKLNLMVQNHLLNF
jgi:hypothetical protein